MNPDKVMRLVALAGNNPNENEARTAAYLACKAIRESGLVLLEPTDPRLRLGTGGWGSPPPRPEPPPRRPEPPPPPPRNAYQEAKERAQQAKARPLPRKQITLQFDDACRGCRVRLEAGERAWWRKGDGCLCDDCYDQEQL